IFMIRGLKSARPPAQRKRALALVERCQTAQGEGESVGLSAVSVSELEFGAHLSADYSREITAVQKLLAPFDVYDYDAVACPRQYGRVRHGLERLGQPIGSMDMLIAAHALALDAILVTNNLAHFHRVDGLKATSCL
ncbi:MAG: type II toxin-antitoxin system VapC family toxin, partial [Planctomycetaceae bacterium]